MEETQERTHYAEFWTLGDDDKMYITIVCNVKQPPKRFEIEVQLMATDKPVGFDVEKVYCPFCGRLLQISPVMDINVIDLTAKNKSEGEKR